LPLPFRVQAKALLAEMLKSRMEAAELAAQYNIGTVPKSTKVRAWSSCGLPACV